MRVGVVLSGHLHELAYAVQGQSQEIFHGERYSVFGIRKYFISKDPRSLVFENFSLAKIFGLWYSNIFHKRRSSVFGIRELLEPNSTNIFLF